MLMGGGLVVSLSLNSRILAIPMPCILKCNLWLPNSLMHCIYPGQKLNITRITIWFLCVYQKTHPCFCFIYSAPVLIAERKNALKILVLYVFQCWLFCFNEWEIEEFAIPQTSFSSGYKLRITLLILVWFRRSLTITASIGMRCTTLLGSEHRSCRM